MDERGRFWGGRPLSTVEGPITVLHLLRSSLPEVDGYAIRSASLFHALRAQGIEIVAATVPEFGEGTETETHEGVAYHRWSEASLGAGWRWARRILRYRAHERANREAEHYADIARRSGVRIVHSHSGARCGMIGARIAARLGLPYVCEVRGPWDEPAVSDGKLAPGSVAYDKMRRMQIRTVRAADRLIVASAALREYVVAEMGADPSVCVVAPDGVDSEKFCPLTGDNPLRADPRLGSGPVLGWVGSLRRWEGLDLAVRCLARLRDRFPDVRLAIVGEGPEREALSALAAEEGVADRVVLVGSVPHGELPLWYDRIDLFVVPRVDTAIARLVTPLTTLEAMSMARPVLLSDVGGHRDLIAVPGASFSFRAGDLDDLVAKASEALADGDARRAMGARARAWVVSERSWGRAAATCRSVYAELLADPPKLTSTRRQRLDPTPAPGRWVAVWSLLVGGAILLLSRTTGPEATPYVQALLLSQCVIFLAAHGMSRRAAEGSLFRAAADTFFDVGFAASLLGLATWSQRERMPVERLPLTLASVGAYCMFSASQVGFHLLGKAEFPAFWSTVRFVLALGTAVLATIRLDFWPLTFVLVASTTAWALHAALVWHGEPPTTAPPSPPQDPEARIAKPRDNIVDKLVFRPFSRRLSLPLARAGVSPNLVTIAALILGALAAWEISMPETMASLIGAVLLQISFLADCVDGEVARAQGRVSAFGAWFDWMSDRFVTLLAILGLGWGARHETIHQTAVIWASTLALIACEIFPRSFRDKTSFIGTISRGGAAGPATWGAIAAFHHWRERRGLGMSLGPGALILVVGVGAALGAKFETLLLLMVVRGLALLYKLTRIVMELES